MPAAKPLFSLPSVALSLTAIATLLLFRGPDPREVMTSSSLTALLVVVFTGIFGTAAMVLGMVRREGAWRWVALPATIAVWVLARGWLR